MVNWNQGKPHASDILDSDWKRRGFVRKDVRKTDVKEWNCSILKFYGNRFSFSYKNFEFDWD